MKKYSGSGSPFVRGGMDSYYHRPRNPHYYIDGTQRVSDTPCQIRIEEMTEEEEKQYHAGLRRQRRKWEIRKIGDDY